MSPAGDVVVVGSSTVKVSGISDARMPMSGEATTTKFLPESSAWYPRMVGAASLSERKSVVDLRALAARSTSGAVLGDGETPARSMVKLERPRIDGGVFPVVSANW